MEKVKDLISQVLEEMEVGSFPSKAQQKEALQKVSQAYDRIRDKHIDQNLGDGYFWDVPLELHHATPKRLAALKKTEGVQGFNEFELWTSQLRDLREAVKATPVVKEPSKSQKEKVEKLHKSLEEILGDLDQMVEVGSLFKGLPISATPHSVCRDGRWYRRVFFYWAGKLTPLSTILAAVEQIRENKA